MQIASAVGTCHQPSSTLAPWGGNSQDYKEGPSRLLAPPSWCPLGSSSILEQELVILMVHKVPPVCPLRPTLCPPGCLLHPPAFSPNVDPSPAPSSVCLHLDASYSITLGGRLKMQDTTRMWTVRQLVTARCAEATVSALQRLTGTQLGL